MDSIILAAFIYMKYLSDPCVLLVAGAGIILILLFQYFFMRSHTDEDGKMHMEMTEEGAMKM
jgi:tRNA1(Val) A37 N6-methylase TrmN6